MASKKKKELDHEALQMAVLEAIMDEMDKYDAKKMKPLTVKVEIAEEVGKKKKTKPKEKDDE